MVDHVEVLGLIWFQGDIGVLNDDLTQFSSVLGQFKGYPRRDKGKRLSLWHKAGQKTFEIACRYCICPFRMKLLDPLARCFK